MTYEDLTEAEQDEAQEDPARLGRRDPGPHQGPLGGPAALLGAWLACLGACTVGLGWLRRKASNG